MNNNQPDAETLIVSACRLRRAMHKYYFLQEEIARCQLSSAQMCSEFIRFTEMTPDALLPPKTQVAKQLNLNAI